MISAERRDAAIPAASDLRVFVARFGAGQSDGSVWTTESVRVVGTKTWQLHDTVVLPAELTFDVLILHCSETALIMPALTKVRAALEKQNALDCGLCLLHPLGAPTSLEWFLAGVDSMAVSHPAGDAITSAIFTAFKIGMTRKSLSRQVQSLETTIDRMRKIDHAKSIMAQRLKITEHLALQRLRKESRDQRRPMHELAQILLDANKLFHDKAPRDLPEIKNGSALGEVPGSVHFFDPHETTL